ncbi:MAG: large conductance mechanosensitive channel protein MscL [Patescibacteria group bacterium]
MKHFFEEFKKFALRGNAVDLAIGVVIGTAFTAITNSLVTNILTPPIGLLLGGIDFSALGFTLQGDAVIQYGLFIEACVNFIITALALFLFVKFINRLVLVARREQEEGTAPASEKSQELVVLEEIRDALRKG